MGVGMLLASLIATIYYYEWDIYDMSFDTVLIIGGGTMLFTFYCILFSHKKVYMPRYNKEKAQLIVINKGDLKVVLCLLIMGGAMGCYAKYALFASLFGERLDLPSLILAAREEFVDKSTSFELPFYIKLLSYSNSLFLGFSIWILVVQLISRKRDLILIILLLCQIFVVCVDGMFSGAKGAMMDPFIYFIIVYILLSCYVRNSYNMPMSFYKKIIGLFIFLVLVFGSFNAILGRGLDIKSTDFFAAYCGAEIKNFDTYIQNPAKFGESKYFYGSTFGNLYNSLGIKKEESSTLYNSVNGNYLGNVYTQFYSFHRDGGFWGIAIILLLIAFLSMKVYCSVIKSLRSDLVNPTVSLLAYLWMANSLFMSFFSSRFTEGVVQLGFLKSIILYMVMLLLYKRTMVKKNIINIK